MARLIEVDLDVVEKEFYTDLTAFYHDSYGRGFTAGGISDGENEKTCDQAGR